MLTAGVDEVGRGTLAGPVVVSACVLKEGYKNPLIRDSKKISFNKRIAIDKIIREEALSISLGVICNLVIDKINILEATKQAMHIAISKIATPVEKIIIDAVKLKNIDTLQVSEFKADDKYIEVSAASIVAKVYRDKLMIALSEVYPEYGFEHNFGYGTKAHIEAIKKYGATPIHRMSFLKGIL